MNTTADSPKRASRLQVIVFLKRHSLVSGIVLMFLLTWPIDLANSGVLPVRLPFAVTVFLGWGFIAAAIIMTGLTLGRAGVIALLKRYFQWRVGWLWYLAAFGLVPLPWIAGVPLYAAVSQARPDFSTSMIYQILGESPNVLLFILPWFLFEVITNGEEIGWRGYILPRLQAKYNALASTLMLAVVWGFWHLPKFLPDFDVARFAWYLLHILAFAVLLTWLYNSTKGSLLMVVIAHAVSNTVATFLPVGYTTTNENFGAFITAVLLEAVLAIVIIRTAGPVHLSRTVPKQVQA